MSDGKDVARGTQLHKLRQSVAVVARRSPDHTIANEEIKIDKVIVLGARHRTSNRGTLGRWVVQE